MGLPQISQELRDYIAGIKAKRARIVLNHILQYGYITTKDLQETYGYDHPPRAAKDVRDNGVQLKTTMKVIDGKRMAVYTLDEDSLSWYDKDVQIYDHLKDEAVMADQGIEDYVKEILKAHIQNNQADKYP